MTGPGRDEHGERWLDEEASARRPPGIPIQNELAGMIVAAACEESFAAA